MGFKKNIYIYFYRKPLELKQNIVTAQYWMLMERYYEIRVTVLTY